MTDIEIAERILPVYLAVQRKHGKDYSFASQLTILQLLLRFRGYKKCRATLNRYLRRLEDAGYIKRIRRIKRDKIKGMMFNSSIMIICLKGYHVLRRLGLNVWKEINNLLNKLRNKYPEFAARSKKKEKLAEKINPKAPDLVRKILNGLGKNVRLVA